MYKLSQHIDPNKIFIVNCSELEGRIDPSVYKKSFCFQSKVFRSYKLSEIAFINPDTSFDKLDKDAYITFVPMDAIDEKNGVVSKVLYRKESESKGYTRFKENDLIWAKITPCMQNGNSAVVRNTKQGYVFGSTEFFVIRPKNDNVLVDYIYILFRDKRVLISAMNFFGGSAGQQRVPKVFLENFKIPLPPIDIQQQIVNVYQAAYQQKQQIETEAQTLLASIDDYLLRELGITMPTTEINVDEIVSCQDFELNRHNPVVKKGRLFLTMFSEVENRIDPHYYQKYFIDSFKMIANSVYPTSKLKNISSVITSGITPLSKGESYTNSIEGIPFVRSGDIDINGDINFNNMPYLKQDIHQTLMKSSQLQYGDLMIAIVGATIGQIGIYMDEREANINQAIALVRLNEKNNPQYVKELIKSSIGQLSLNRLKRPVARANINLEEISTILVLVPPLEKQTEIALHISEIRKKAKCLQIEAANILENAKQKIEQLILAE